MASFPSAFRIAARPSQIVRPNRLSSRALYPPIPTRNALLRQQSHFRLYSSTSASAVEPPEYLDENERKVFDRIKETLQPSKLEVQDISGGCGSMYMLDITSEQFKGLTTIKQHRLVTETLKDMIKGWHGVRMTTRAPE